MLKKTITYTDYNGVERTEDFYFHLNQAEVVEWLTTKGDYTIDKVIEKMNKEGDNLGIMKMLKDLILRSVGEKSLDGTQFIKNDTIASGFQQKEAFSVLFMDLVSDPDKAAEFFAGIMPAKLSESVEKMMAENKTAYLKPIGQNNA